MSWWSIAQNVSQKISQTIFPAAAKPKAYESPFDERMFDIENYPHAETVRQQAAQMFGHIPDVLNSLISPDDEGRSFRILITKYLSPLGGDPGVDVTIYRLNDKEMIAMKFFHGEGSWHAISPDGISFGSLNARSYDFSIRANMPDEDRLLFVGYAPMQIRGREDNHLDLRQFTRTNLDRIYQGMMFDLKLQEASKFQIMDWKALKELLEKFREPVSHVQAFAPVPL